MTISKGLESLVARKKSAVWGTAVDVNEANSQFMALNFTFGNDSSPEILPNEELNGTPHQLASDTGAYTLASTVDFYLRYDGLDLDFAMLFGRAGTPAIAGGAGSGGSVAYSGRYQMRDSLETYMCTWIVNEQVAIQEIDSVKYNQLTVAGEAGNRITGNLSLMGRRLENASSINTSVASITEPSPRVHVMFEDAKFFLKAQTGTALNGDDQIYPSSFTFTINNNTTGELTSENDPYIDEPVRTNWSEVTGTITIPKYKGTTIEDAYKNKTAQKFAIRCISSTQIVNPGQGGYYSDQNWYFPLIELTGAPRDIGGAGLIPGGFEFIAKKADTAPDGMDGNGGLEQGGTEFNEARGSITNPVELEVMNVNNADPLA